MSELLTTEALSALLQVIMIDLVLAGDNAIVIGLAAAGLPKDQRSKTILHRYFAATSFVSFSRSATTQLLQIVGLFLQAVCCCFGFAGKCGGSFAPAMPKKPKPMEALERTRYRW